MNRHRTARIRRKSHARFRLRFQSRMAEYLAGAGSAAEGFGIVWEKTLEEFPLSDPDQAELYRELILWAKSDDLFTGPIERGLIQAWKETVHD